MMKETVSKVKNFMKEKLTVKKAGDTQVVVAVIMIVIGIGLVLTYRDAISTVITDLVTNIGTKISTMLSAM